MNTKSPTNAELLTNLMLLVFRANGYLLDAGNKLVAPLGLTSSRWQVLGALWNQARTVSEIARVMGLTRQSVQRTANTLAEDKFLTFYNNPNHARAALLTLTNKGRAALEKATELQIEWSKNLAKTHLNTELTTAAIVLETLIQSLEKNTKENRK